MTSNTYDHLRDEVYVRILGLLKRPEEKTRRFAVKGTARQVLDDNTLKRFFRSLDLPELTAESHSHTSETDLIARLDDRSLSDFLAIILFMSCTIKAARTFTVELLINKSWSPSKFKLPVGREQLKELFREDIVTVDKFLAHQACFCPITIVKGHEVKIEASDRERLPYLEEKLKAEGSFGKVYEVKIAEGHFLDPLSGTTNMHPAIIARKDYLRADGPGSDDQILKQIVAAGRKCDNIVDFFGSVAIGLITYSLFMPLAICDLKDFMMETYPDRPSGISKKAEVIFSAHGLAGGLDFLHTRMMSGMDRLVCYHMDLKPSNILIYHETNSSETSYIWKISDFGMSRVKVRAENAGVESEKNFNSWILSRHKPQEPSSLGTRNRRGEGTYLAPETIAATPIIKAEADVWSLGCVISVLFAYLEEGSLGVDRYAEKRADPHSAHGFDRFFLRIWGWGFTFKAHPEVKGWHDRLIHQARHRNRKEGDAMEFILRYLENGVFREQSKRCTAQQLREKLFQTYQKYADAREDSDQPPDSEDPARARRDSRKALRWWRPSHNLIDHEPHKRVKTWSLDYEELKGCAFSHDGTLMALWTKKTLSLYTSHSLRGNDPRGNDPRVTTLVSTFQLDNTNDETNRVDWTSISLTERYLIGLNSGVKHQCYRFALLNGPAADANLDRHKKFTLPLSEVFQLAISPESQTMACVVGDLNGDQTPCSLFLAPVASPNQSYWLDKLSWPAKDVTRLFFTTDEDLYLVVRPHVSARSLEYKVHIVHINVSTKRLDTLIIDQKGFDSSSNIGLFTTFAPFRNKPDTFAIITREKQLHIRSLAEEKSSIQTEIKGYRVLRLLVGWDDTKIFAIGTPEAEHGMVLLEITVPQGRGKHISIKELERLPGLSYNAKFMEVLSHQREFKYVLILAPGRAHQHVIYQVALTDPEVTTSS
ncbi:uncharacterized protein N7443_004696 [Penicillium atrosanguineum]|uniref:uncharacterized protein n=1 Tax=Penicillium atrosanguineum TaxID=1132637 RepID=UPI00238CED58|nr:uncharacterized protein N7443_004696 [Penicillium atrosanguineum]KAJ5305036.1 hypothetical protein N7443_004696 [Penicillium atrosanguineum]